MKYWIYILRECSVEDAAKIVQKSLKAYHDGDQVNTQTFPLKSLEFK